MRMRAKAIEHIGQHMINTNAQRKMPIRCAPDDLHRRVAVAQVIGATGKLIGVVALDFEHFFGRGEYAHDALVAAIVNPFETVTPAQHRVARQKQGGFFSGGQAGAQAALLAQFVGQCELGIWLSDRSNTIFESQHSGFNGVVTVCDHLRPAIG